MKKQIKCPDSCFPNLESGSTRLKFCEKHKGTKLYKMQLGLKEGYIVINLSDYPQHIFKKNIVIKIYDGRKIIHNLNIDPNKVIN